MNDEELKALFDQMAPGYDKQWDRTAPITRCLYFLLESTAAMSPLRFLSGSGCLRASHPCEMTPTSK